MGKDKRREVGTDRDEKWEGIRDARMSKNNR